MTDVFEGSIIRCIRRLEEVLRQMCQAAKTIGNTELENKFAGGTLPPQIPSTSNPFNLQLPSFFLSIQPSIHPSIHPLSIHSSIHPTFIHPFSILSATIIYLFHLYHTGILKIKRDIVFAASLYL